MQDYSADNARIMEILNTYLKRNPSVRFGQALVNIGIVKVDEMLIKSPSGSSSVVCWADEFYICSNVLLDRVRETMKSSKV